MMVMVSLPSLFAWFGDAGAGLYAIAWFAVSTLYPVFFEALWNGATPGKRVCNLAVVHADGTPVGWPAAFLRNIVRIADALPVGYAIGFVTMLFDPQFRRLGRPRRGHRGHPSRRGGGQGSPRRHATPGMPSPVALSALEQRAVLDFDERRGGWSPERAAELAETAAPLVGTLRGEAAVARVAAIASHLQGRR